MSFSTKATAFPGQRAAPEARWKLPTQHHAPGLLREIASTIYLSKWIRNIEGSGVRAVPMNGTAPYWPGASPAPREIRGKRGTRRGRGVEGRGVVRTVCTLAACLTVSHCFPPSSCSQLPLLLHFALRRTVVIVVVCWLSLLSDFLLKGSYLSIHHGILYSFTSTTSRRQPAAHCSCILPRGHLQ